MDVNQDAGISALRQFLRVIRRGAWVVVLTTVAVTALAILSSNAQEKRYEASSEVFLSGARNLPSSVADLATQYYIDPVRAAETQARLARVPEVARSAVAEAGRNGWTPDELLANSEVIPNADADLLEFTVTAGRPEVASRFATAYARAFTAYRRELDTGALVEARRQIERRLDSLEGARGTTLYRDLAADAQNLRTQEALQGSNAALIRPGADPVQTQPKTTRNAALGVVLGLVLGVALAFLRDALNTRVRTAEEVQERLQLPLLGRVPQLPKRLTPDEGLAMLDEPQAPVTESYRILATNLGFANLDRGAKTIMVTSATRGEGKSTTVANTAVALAQAGSRVALVDLDLKRPSLDRMLGLRGRRLPGLSEVVLGSVRLNDALIRIPVHSGNHLEPGASQVGPEGGLGVMQTGPIPPNTADFVASSKLTHVLEQLSDISDLVLIDAPPILHLSDAIALTAKVDALVVITRISAIRRPALSELRRVLDASPVAKLGFVLTGVRPRHDRGYGYGYGYAYGDTSANGASRRRLLERSR